MIISCELTAIAAALIFIFFIHQWQKSRNSKINSIKLPPGPKPLPIIGNLHLITSLPFRCLRELSNHYGPIMHLRLGSSATAVVSSPEIAKALLKNLDPSYAHRPRSVTTEVMWSGYLDIAFSPYGGYWRQMRQICINELLSPKLGKSFQSIRIEEASRLIDSISGIRSPVNLTERIFAFSSSILCRSALGGVCGDGETLIALMVETLEALGGFEIGDFVPSSRILRVLSWTRRRRLRAMRRKLDVILDEVIDRHRQNRAEIGDRRDSGGRRFGGEDLVDAFLRVKEEEKLQFPINNDNIKAVLYDMFAAGTDTSATTIDWTMVELMRNPRVMAKAQAEVRQAMKGTNSEQNDVVHNLKYLKLVIKETLRLHPPVPMLPRTSNEGHKINGYTIPAQTNLVVNIWAIHRDPRFWNDPEEFVPERFENHQALDSVGGDFKYLPFGCGKRVCHGITFGMTIVELALAQLLYKFDWKLPEGVRAEDLNMIENVGITALRKDNLLVVATPY